MTESFEHMLTGGHPNSLGRTIEVVDIVLSQPNRFDELFHCYFSEDEIVRLRVSNAMKRLSAARLDLLVPYIDRFTDEIALINQASTQWTLAILFKRLSPHMNPSQHQKALNIMQRNITSQRDWIVLNFTMETLADWAAKDKELRDWLMPVLAALVLDSRASVAARAKKYQTALS